MKSKDYFLGLDGCPAGWFYFGLSGTGDHAFGVARDAAGVAAIAESARLVLIDIPIGLKDAGGGERLCDEEARRVLGGARAASVFRAPVRQALDAATFEEAAARNCAVTGKRLSRQCWAICSRIREIDRLLAGRPDLRPVFREMHPEVCFWGLNGGRPPMHGKKDPAGRRERIDILAEYFPVAESAMAAAARAYGRRAVGLDDILDAMAGAVTARLGQGRLESLPASPERDPLGLPMEIVFARPGSRGGPTGPIDAGACSRVALR